jgi:hypothetical protein
MASNASSLSPRGSPSRQSFVRRYLDPTESLGEVMFGLIMVLTFTLGAGLIVKEGTEATTGIAPGLRGSLNWWRLELYGEAEYVFNTRESADSFFYMWSELTVSPMPWLRIGLVGQRTRAYESELDIQRGFLVGLTYKQVGVTGYVFNPDKDNPTYVISVGVEF